METSDQVNAIRRMVREIAELAENASLTGALPGGAPAAIKRYNACIERLIDLGVLPDGFFKNLDPATTSYDELGVEARLLASYIRDAQKGNGGRDPEMGIILRLAPFVDRSDLSTLIRDSMAKGVEIDSHTLSNLAPFMDRGFLGELIRNSLRKSKEPEKASPQPSPAQPNPSTEIVAVPEPEKPRFDSVDDLIAELSRPGLTPEERKEIAMRLARASQEQ